MSKFVLDSSAVLAFLNQERGAEIVAERIPFASISAVNLAEVFGKSIEGGHTISSALESIALLNLAVVNFDSELAVTTAELRASTRPLGLSLGDRCCLALAMVSGATAVTADRSWKSLDVCQIEFVR